MKTNMGSDRSGYHFISFIAAEKPMLCPPVPQSAMAATTATKPMMPNTRCPVIIMRSMVENIRAAINS